jgi:lipopolysaccharide/colanic/teichoic acid biosynthesis glycosyltransferase
MNKQELLEKVENPDKYYVEVIMQDKLSINLEYVEKCSFWFDVELIFKTFWEIITK